MAISTSIWVKLRRLVCICIVLCLAFYLSMRHDNTFTKGGGTHLFSDTTKSWICAWILLPKEEYIEHYETEDKDNGPGSPASHFR